MVFEGERMHIIRIKLSPGSCCTLDRDFFAIGYIASLNQVIYGANLFTRTNAIVFWQLNAWKSIHSRYHRSIHLYSGDAGVAPELGAANTEMCIGGEDDVYDLTLCETLKIKQDDSKYSHQNR